MALFAPAMVTAQQPTAPIQLPAVQSPVEAISRDAAMYASHYGVTRIEAMRRLRLQQESVATVDRLAATYRDRLAGIVIEHVPDYRVVLLLTGADPVPDQRLPVADLVLPVVFRTGAAATRDRVLAALAEHADDIRVALSSPPGMGADPRGLLVVVVRAGEIASEGAASLTVRLGAIAGVPVEVRSASGVDSNLAIEGGSRLIGTRGDDGRRFLCTTGFVVTDGARTAITTAAHCPDEVRYIDPAGVATPLAMIGAWGARYQDVQIHEPSPATGPPLEPLFQADAVDGRPRRLTSWRNRTSTRVGDFVCHRGERTGYSCAEVEFTDYVPPGDLCAGACAPSWVAVRGPTCRGGDSGGPVFSGTVAFGIVKGSSYTADGVCRRYYYMSTDDLPAGWTLLH